MGAALEDKEKKAARKAALREEAAKLGVSYEELKAQKKDKKKRKREAESLRSDTKENVEGGESHRSEIKRMRSWSKDFENDGKKKSSSSSNSSVSSSESGPTSKRRRTRSMDANENFKEEIKHEKSLSPDAWRKEHNITIRGHGSNSALTSYPDPYLLFDDAPFNSVIQQALRGAGFAAPTPIQSQAWPIAVKGNDMICIAKTGSGKTCGFLLPSLHQFVQNRPDVPQQMQGGGRGGYGRGGYGRGGYGRGGGRGRGRGGYDGPPADAALLVLAPTRELACQIQEEVQKFGRPVGFRSVCCYGGSNKWTQIAQLQRGIECIIATPGRLNDLLEMKKVNLTKVKFLVLDEADRMLDMGFEPQIRSIVKHVPEERQTLLFSATWPKEIQRLAHDFLKNPIQINVGEVDALNANKDIKQNIHMISEDEKFGKLTEILKKVGREAEEAGKDPKDHVKLIVFVAKKISCHDLANQLWEDGFAVDSLHGDRVQWERTKVINAFKTNALRMLIATDVAARGLDVKDVGMVVNYDMPVGVSGVEDYVHRIGRTGRAGAKGIAHTFFTPGDRKCAKGLVEVLTKANQEVPSALLAMVPRFHPGGRGGRGRGYGRGGYGRGGYGGRSGGGRSYMGGGGGRGGGRGRRF